MLLLVAGMESPMAGIKFKAEYDPHSYPEKALAALNPAWLNPAGSQPDGGESGGVPDGRGLAGQYGCGRRASF